MTGLAAAHIAFHPTSGEFVAVIFFALGYIANHFIEHRR